MIVYEVVSTIEGRVHCPDYESQVFPTFSEAIAAARDIFPTASCYYVMPVVDSEVM